MERRKTRSARAKYVPSKTTTALWTEKETRALVGVWGAEDVQSQLDMVGRNEAIIKDCLVSRSQTIGTIKHGNSAKRRLKT